MKITFIAGTGEPATRRSYKPRRACESCRRRKRRCNHVDQLSPRSIDVTSPRHRQSSVSQISLAPSPNPPPPASDDIAECRRVIPGPDLSRFVGDLNPETVFFANEGGHRGQSQSDKDQVGLWVPKDTDISNGRRSGTTKGSGSRSSTPWPVQRFYPVTRLALEPYLKDQCLGICPCYADQMALIQIYFRKVNPILPIVDEVDFRHSLAQETASRMLIQAVCLVACKYNVAKVHCRVSGEEEVSQPREFAQRLFAALTTGLSIKLERERITLIQILTLLSLHVEGPDGGEEASIHLTEAIHHAVTIGLHLDRSRDDHQGSDFLKRLFCCLWSLDKLNAGVNGRPVLLHDRDIGRELHSFIKMQTDVFGVWTHIADLLGVVISLYRPSADSSVTGLEEDFPSFEEIVENRTANAVDPVLLATVEIFYHAVAILSCRSKSFGNTFRSTPSSVRQSLSAVRIMTIAGTEFRQVLSPLPVVPYALSLSMSVAYRQWRQSNTRTFRRRARDQFELGCTLLQELSSLFWSAEAMAKLGQHTLAEVEKAHRSTRGDSTMDQTRRTHQHRETGRAPASDVQAVISSDGHIASLGISQDTLSRHGDLPSAGIYSGVTNMDYLDSLHQGFEDLDALFGSQLDLSFPINYGDLLALDDNETPIQYPVVNI